MVTCAIKSDKVAVWNESDVRNAHMWAVWVQDAVRDRTDDKTLKTAVS